ncbi:MAG: hypothetical protein AMXMBFR56_00060 [Polyangiaceae bacterium]
MRERSKAMGKLWAAGLAALLPMVVGCSSSDDGNGGSGGSGAVGGTGGSGGLGGAAGTGGAAGSGGASACSAPPRSFWTWDLGVMPPADIQVPSTCRGETANGYIYVADESWNVDMDQTAVDTIAAAFASSTPADPARGIYQTNVETFGAPPDVDGDPHVVLFYAPMKGYQGYSFDGFFRADDQTAGDKSNLAEMLHMNAKGGQAPASEYMLGVAAHELVHLIAWKYDPQEEGWLEEAMAEAAMVVAGYMTDLPAAKAYAKKTASTPLCVKSYSDYGATFAFGTYVLDRFGSSFLRDVLQDPKDGRQAIEAHLPSGVTFRSLFGELMVATLLDQPGIGDGRYGFESVDLGALGSETAAMSDGNPHELDAVAFGARMLRFSPGAGSLSVTLTSTELAKLVVHSVVLDPALPASAKVSAHDPSSGAIALTLAAGQVADLVVAVDPGATLADSKSAPMTKFTYTATFTP